MRVYVNSGDAIFRAIKELGLKRDESMSGMKCDEYVTPTGSKVRFYIDTTVNDKPYKEVLYWRSYE